MLPGLEIREATTAAERDAVFQLRYEVYVEELGFYRDVADHEGRRLRDADDTDAARLLYATQDGRLVATARAHLGRDGPLPDELRRIYEIDRFSDLVPVERMSTLTRFMVTADQRGSMLPLAMLVRLMELHVREGVELSFCDTEPHLVGLYSRLGMRQCGRPFNDSAGRLMMPMIGLVDGKYLEEIGAPLLAFVQVPHCSDALRAAIEARVSERRTVRDVDAMDDAEEWTALYATLTSPTASRTSLLEGLDQDETKALLAHAHVVECRRDEAIIRTDHAARTVFVVLEGTVEVRDGGRVVATMGERAVFGEVAFLLGGRRMSDVYAASDRVRVLTLSDGTLRELIRSQSQLAAKLLLNLSRALAAKLLDRHALAAVAGR